MTLKEKINNAKPTDWLTENMTDEEIVELVTEAKEEAREQIAVDSEGEGMRTKVYGVSDDLVEVETEKNIYPYDEIGCFDSMVRILFTDNTVIEVEYGKDGKGIWKIEVIHKGNAKQKLTICDDEDAEIYSDIFEIDADFDRCTVI